LQAIKDKLGRNPGSLHRAYEVVKRAAAIDTGAIEGLYEVDRGFTYTIAFETTAWELALAERGERVRPLFEAQLHAYDYVLDLATKAEPISEAAIRTLHEVVCRAQETYRVQTPIGFQEQPLPKGKYKVLPNHVLRTREGTNHSYAPVDVTPVEMARLVHEMRSERFLSAHPVIQASYVHYGLVSIHPFADGNGRVARALASAFTYRAISMPIMILSEHKEKYLDALESADRGEFQTFADFMLRRVVDTMMMVEDSLRSAHLPRTEESLAAINSPSGRRAKYSNQQVDEGGTRLLKAIEGSIQKEVSDVALGKIQGRSGITAGSHRTFSSTHRPSQNVGQHLYVELMSIHPSRLSSVSLPPAVVSRRYDLFVPRDAGEDDEYLMRERESDDDFAMPVDDVLPVLSGTLQLRIEIFARRVIQEMLAVLSSEIERLNPI
jgi:Fic family protein